MERYLANARIRSANIELVDNLNLVCKINLEAWTDVKPIELKLSSGLNALRMLFIYTEVKTLGALVGQIVRVVIEGDTIIAFGDPIDDDDELCFCLLDLDGTGEYSLTNKKVVLG